MDTEEVDNKPKDKVKSKYVARTPVDLQRIKVEKLMENPDKPVSIPMSNKQKNFMAAIPTFVRNVMGSSAGAGSGEFHVYRHLRRKEYARQKHIQHKSKQEELDDEYQQKIENNRVLSESKTAKKRAKRLKKKINAKNRPKKTIAELASNSGDESDSDEDAEDREKKDNEDDQEEPAAKKTKLPDDETQTNDSECIVINDASATKENTADASAQNAAESNVEGTSDVEGTTNVVETRDVEGTTNMVETSEEQVEETKIDGCPERDECSKETVAETFNDNDIK